MANNALFVTLCSFVALILAYRWYGRFLGRRIFQLNEARPTPAHTMEDGVDYVPTKVPVLFGHHFASIAGLGPILGPAIAVIWGWLPAVIWVVVGSIFMGAVHDLGALTVSLRFKGRSIGDVCRELVGPRARMLFLIIIFFAMCLAMGAFVNAISALFVNYNPDAIIPSFGLIVVAMIVGISVYKLKVGLGPATLLGLVVFAGLIVWGGAQPVPSYEMFADAETNQTLQAAKGQTVAEGEPTFEKPYGLVQAKAYLTASGTEEAQLKQLDEAASKTRSFWVYGLLIYGFIAAVLPVWLLLQPRDYLNSFQLYFALGFMVLGLVVAAFTSSPQNHIDAEAFRGHIITDKPWLPFLFVTIACGAISGFHSLVSSGTTVRQLNRETDAVPIGYGAMLTEGALAVLVIMACVAGLGASAWGAGGDYSTWKSLTGAGSLGAPLAAVIGGGANFLNMLGVPIAFGRTFLAVTIVSFALTTLDSATRLLRFNVEEIFRGSSANVLSNRYVASFIAILGIAAFGLLPVGKPLWILFGTTNQLLAGLTLLTVSLFLYKLNRPVWYTLIPMVLMLSATVWAMIYSLVGFFSGDQPYRWVLIIVTLAEMAMSFWLLAEAALSFSRGRGGLDFDDEDEGQPKTEDSMLGEITTTN